MDLKKIALMQFEAGKQGRGKTNLDHSLINILKEKGIIEDGSR